MRISSSFPRTKLVRTSLAALIATIVIGGAAPSSAFAGGRRGPHDVQVNSSKTVQYDTAGPTVLQVRPRHAPVVDQAYSGPVVVRNRRVASTYPTTTYGRTAGGSCNSGQVYNTANNGAYYGRTYSTPYPTGARYGNQYPVVYPTNNGAYRTYPTAYPTYDPYYSYNPFPPVDPYHDSHTGRNVAIIAGSTAGGAVIGGMVGGKQGAVLGAIVGAAASTISTVAISRRNNNRYNDYPYPY
jgi:hypothetical protein